MYRRLLLSSLGKGGPGHSRGSQEHVVSSINFDETSPSQSLHETFSFQCCSRRIEKDSNRSRSESGPHIIQGGTSTLRKPTSKKPKNSRRFQDSKMHHALRYGVRTASGIDAGLKGVAVHVMACTAVARKSADA
jgi:hypothetical protein